MIGRSLTESKEASQKTKARRTKSRAIKGGEAEKLNKESFKEYLDRKVEENEMIDKAIKDSLRDKEAEAKSDKELEEELERASEISKKEKAEQEAHENLNTNEAPEQEEPRTGNEIITGREEPLNVRPLKSMPGPGAASRVFHNPYRIVILEYQGLTEYKFDRFRIQDVCEIDLLLEKLQGATHPEEHKFIEDLVSLKHMKISHR